MPGTFRCRSSASRSVDRRHEQHTQRREVESHRTLSSMHGSIGRFDGARHAGAGTPIPRVVTVEERLPPSADRYADAITGPGHRRQVQDDEDGTVSTFAKEAQHAGSGVAGIDPLEPGGVAVFHEQGFLTSVQGVEVLHPALHPGVVVVFENEPFELPINRPFGSLSELTTHEQALLCLLYTSDAADDLTRVDLGGRRIIKK